MRDKYLTEAMGECWHKCDEMGFYCDMCAADIPMSSDFSTWEGFGKLWEWAQEQEWWDTFSDPAYGYEITHGNPLFSDIEEAINPDRFADAVYEFLKGAE